MCTERIVSLGIPINHSNMAFHLYIKKINIETESMIKSTCRMHYCNVLENHLEDGMVVLGSKLSSGILNTAFDFDV